MAGKILVLGSSNIDLILKVPRFHQPGETIQAEDLVTAFGGKGANQAIAAKRLGGKVSFITKVGRDGYGESYRRYLIRSGLDPKGILVDKKAATGMALIELAPGGENRIILSPGANAQLTPRDLESLFPLGPGPWVFVAQMEIPLLTVHQALKRARKQGALNVLNPAPALPLSRPILSLVDFLVPNELEAQALTGIPMNGKADLPRIAARLLGQGVSNVIITLGAKGLFFKNRQEEIWMKAFPVKAIDTTAAGDAFVGALAVGISENRPMPEILRWASGAGALATTKLGAQPSLPLKRALMRFLREKQP